MSLYTITQFDGSSLGAARRRGRRRRAAPGAGVIEVSTTPAQEAAFTPMAPMPAAPMPVAAPAAISRVVVEKSGQVIGTFLTPSEAINLAKSASSDGTETFIKVDGNVLVAYKGGKRSVDIFAGLGAAAHPRGWRRSHVPRAPGAAPVPGEPTPAPVPYEMMPAPAPGPYEMMPAPPTPGAGILNPYPTSAQIPGGGVMGLGFVGNRAIIPGGGMMGCDLGSTPDVHRQQLKTYLPLARKMISTAENAKVSPSGRQDAALEAYTNAIRAECEARGADDGPATVEAILIGRRAAAIIRGLRAQAAMAGAYASWARSPWSTYGAMNPALEERITASASPSVPANGMGYYSIERMYNDQV
jgi:hypothetical protein